MCRVLLLTKYVCSNKELVRNIHKLGHEVFSSASLLESLSYQSLSAEFIREFHTVLLSETIPNSECNALLSIFEKCQIPVIQLTEAEVYEEDQALKKELGVDYCLPSQASLTMLREALDLHLRLEHTHDTSKFSKLRSFKENDILTH